MVGNDVEHNPQAQRVGKIEQLIELLEGPKEGVDIAVIADIVTLIHLGRRLERSEPDAVHTERRDIRKTRQ
ncbi:hypothetical protein GCM10009582_05470 [Arthrobacter flavus]